MSPVETRWRGAIRKATETVGLWGVALHPPSVPTEPTGFRSFRTDFPAVSHRVVAQAARRTERFRRILPAKRLGDDIIDRVPRLGDRLQLGPARLRGLQNVRAQTGRFLRFAAIGRCFGTSAARLKVQEDRSKAADLEYREKQAKNAATIRQTRGYGFT